MILVRRTEPSTVRRAPLAQLVEQAALNRRVVGSSPTGCTGVHFVNCNNTDALLLVRHGLLAQLVRVPPCHGGGHGFKPRTDR